MHRQFTNVCNELPSTPSMIWSSSIHTAQVRECSEECTVGVHKTNEVESESVREELSCHILTSSRIAVLLDAQSVGVHAL